MQQLGGNNAATTRAVLTYPKLLALDASRDIYQQRIRFYVEQCGARPE